MSSKTTKTVSVRLPMDYYFKILEETSKNNITISDYILMRIHSNISNSDLFSNNTNEDLEKQNKELIESIDILTRIFSHPQIKHILENKDIQKEFPSILSLDGKTLRKILKQINYNSISSRKA